MTASQQASPDFLREVQNVLQAFYNPSELQKSGLLALLGLDQERDPAGALRRIFREAIRSLKPEEKTPRHSTAWRLYFVLSNRYIEQLSQKEVADELALSTRQIRRYERLAVMVMANTLWKQASLPEPVPTSENRAPALPGTPHEREQELSWLKSSSPIEVSSVAVVIGSALKVAAPLIRSSGGDIRYEAPDHLPPLAGQVSSIKQALLELLTAAISAAPGGQVWVQAEAGQRQIRVRVQTVGGQAAAWADDSETMGKIDIARQLTHLSGGDLELESVTGSQASFAAVLILPAADQISVLAMDDNPDALQLLQRFLSGTLYQLSTAESPQEAFALIEKSPPHIILLDVMLPGVDGWEILGRLREHPTTSSVPVIISTILLQEDLALSLGAAGFLRKPFTQTALLAALDQQAASFLKESR